MAYKWSEMTPRARDLLVAEYVTYHYPFCAKDSFDDHDFMQDIALYHVPKYTTDIEAAWEIVEVCKGVVEIMKWEDNQWECKLSDYEYNLISNGFANNVPEAICLAALRAMGIEVEES